MSLENVPEQSETQNEIISESEFHSSHVLNLRFFPKIIDRPNKKFPIIPLGPFPKINLINPWILSVPLY